MVLLIVEERRDRETDALRVLSSPGVTTVSAWSTGSAAASSAAAKASAVSSSSKITGSVVGCAAFSLEAGVAG